MWHGATVRSTIPRGIIRAIHFDPRIDWTEFAVVTAFDIPGKNLIRLIFDDQPCLADGRVNHCDEAIVLLAHPSKQKLREAAAAIRIEYDPLPAVFTIEESERQDVDHLGRRQSPQELSPRKGRRRFRMVARRAHRRRRIPHRRAGASLHREQRRHRRVRRRERRHRLGLAAVPLLRPQIADGGLQPARRQGARHSNRNRRSVRRQGRLSLHHLRARRAAGDEERPPGEDCL